MIPTIAASPYDCTPIPEVRRENTASVHGRNLNPARPLNNGESIASNEKRSNDSVHLNPPPIVVSTDPTAWEKYYHVTDKQYSDIFRNMALGTEKDEVYKFFFIEDTVALFGNKGDEHNMGVQLKKMITEIKSKFDAGEIDPMSNLQTKFTVGDVEFSFDKLLSAKTHMQYGRNIIRGNETATYSDYADMGIAIGYVKNFAKGMSEEQADLLNGKMAAYVDNRIGRAVAAEKRAEISDGLETHEYRKQFHAYKGCMSATNREYTAEMINLFANLDFSDKGAVEHALHRFGQLEADTENTPTANVARMNRSIEERREKLEGRVVFERRSSSSYYRQIKSDATRGRTGDVGSETETQTAERPKSPNEIVLEHAKEAYKNDTSGNSAESHYAAFANTMLNTYKFIAEQHENFGDWAKYYRDSMREDSDLKKRASAYTDYAAEMFRKDNTLEELMNGTLTAEEEALAYRTYGDAFLTQKAAYYDHAQKDVEEYGYLMGKQYSIAARLLSSKVQKEYGLDDMEMFKLEFHRESFLNNTGDKGFMEQLLLAVGSIEKQLEALEEQEDSSKD